MSYLALYRKYRPSSFRDVVGQDTTIKILKNQILSDRIGHAYLFSGIRGTGKTTLCKIIAMAVNCEHPVDGSPCGECDHCKALSKPNAMDIVEIDAASNRGVDEIRDLREKVVYPPTVGSYKVYIIDEVHMLTKEAFNALLKTLEEPPEHAIFLLATTEPTKLPETIRSRCQHFEIRPIAQSVIAERMREICEKENLVFDDEAYDILSRRANHSMRDGLSLLDQASDLELQGTLITGGEIRELLGSAKEEAIYELIQAHHDHSLNKMTAAMERLRVQGISESLLFEDLLRAYRDLVLIHSGKQSEEVKRKLAFSFELNELYSAMDLLIEAIAKMRMNQMPDLIADTALIRLCLGEEILPTRVDQSVKKQPSNPPSVSSEKIFEKQKSVYQESLQQGEATAATQAVQKPLEEPSHQSSQNQENFSEPAVREKSLKAGKTSMKELEQMVLDDLSVNRNRMAYDLLKEAELRKKGDTFYLVFKDDTTNKIDGERVKWAVKQVQESLNAVTHRNVKATAIKKTDYQQLVRKSTGTEPAPSVQTADKNDEKKTEVPKKEDLSEVQDSLNTEKKEEDWVSKESTFRAIAPGDYDWTVKDQ